MASESHTKNRYIDPRHPKRRSGFCVQISQLRSAFSPHFLYLHYFRFFFIMMLETAKIKKKG